MKQILILTLALFMMFSLVNCKDKNVDDVLLHYGESSFADFVTAWEHYRQGDFSNIKERDVETMKIAEFDTLDTLIVPSVLNSEYCLYNLLVSSFDSRFFFNLAEYKTPLEELKPQETLATALPLQECTIDIIIGRSKEAFQYYALDDVSWENGRGYSAKNKSWFIDYKDTYIEIKLPDSIHIESAAQLDEWFVFELYGIDKNNKVVKLDDNIFQ